MSPISIVIVALAITIIIIMVLCPAGCVQSLLGGAACVLGGGARGRQHIAVVDTLNAAHARTGQSYLRPDDISDTITALSSVLKKDYKEVIFVIKNKSSVFEDSMFEQLAKKNGVRIAVATEYGVQPPNRHSGNPVPSEVDKHARKARDDFLLLLLARKYNGVMVTNDRMKDMSKFRANLQPFRVFTYDWWSTGCDVESIIPDSPAYANMRKPPRIAVPLS